MNLEDVVPLLYGRTIYDVEVWEDEGGQGAEITLELNNGVKVNIGAWGHDWWGLNVTTDAVRASSPPKPT